MDTPFRTGTGRAFRWGGFGLRLSLYILVMGASIAWYCMAKSKGHIGPDMMRLEELNEKLRTAGSRADELALLDAVILVSRDRDEFEYRDALGRANLRKAELVGDPEDGNRLLEGVVDANAGRRDFGLTMLVSSAMRNRVQRIEDAEEWSPADEEFLQKYRHYADPSLGAFLSVVWLKKINGMEPGTDRMRLLAEYRAWLEDHPFDMREIYLGWVLCQQAQAADDVAEKAFFLDAIIERFADAKQEHMLEYAVWAMNEKAGLLDDRDAALTLYREIDARYGEVQHSRVRKQVAYALSRQADLFGGDDRLPLLDEIMARYGDEKDDEFLVLLDRIAKKRLDLLSKQD